METFGSFIAVILFTALIFVTGCLIEDEYHRKKLDAVGISRIKECVIDTENCHSNYYVIIWKDGKGEHK